MTSLKKSGLLRTYYRDRLRGYRLGAKAKAALLDGWPERFSSYLTGDTDTNRLKSEVNRRLRLHRLAETYVTMDNAGIGLFQDEKPKVFSPQGYHGEAIEYPAFYSSREVKEMGIDTTQVRSSRFAGVLLAPTGIFVTYNSGAALMKWRCKSEMRVKALMWSVLCQQRLAGQYCAEDVHGLVLGDSMELAYRAILISFHHIPATKIPFYNLCHFPQFPERASYCYLFRQFQRRKFADHKYLSGSFRFPNGHKPSYTPRNS